MKIAVLYSLPTRRAKKSPYLATDEDTKDSAEEAASALTSKGARTTLIGISEDTIEEVGAIKADVIFNLIEWDGLDTPLTLKILAHLDALKIPYTGSGIDAITLISDKIKMKKALDAAHLPTPRWQLFTTGDEKVQIDLQFPIILKLAWEHCSVGLTKDAIIHQPNALLSSVKERINTFHQPVYVEEFIDGKELQVTLLEREKGLTVLPPAEIVFESKGTNAFLTFESRWNENHPDYDTSHVTKADLSPALMQKLYRLAHNTYEIFNFHDYARLDIRTRKQLRNSGNPRDSRNWEEELYILEANANPGLGDDEDYGMTVSYKAAGMTFADFVWTIVQSSMRRWHNQTN